MEDNTIDKLQHELLGLHLRYCYCRDWHNGSFVVVDDKHNEDLLEFRMKIIKVLEEKVLNKERELASMMSVFRVEYWIRFSGPDHSIKVKCQQLMRINSHTCELQSGSKLDLENPTWKNVFKEVSKILYTCHHSFLINSITKVSNSLPVRIYNNNWKEKIEVKAIESKSNESNHLIVFDDMFPVSCDTN